MVVRSEPGAISALRLLRLSACKSLAVAPLRCRRKQTAFRSLDSVAARLLSIPNEMRYVLRLFLVSERKVSAPIVECSARAQHTSGMESARGRFGVSMGSADNQRCLPFAFSISGSIINIIRRIKSLRKGANERVRFDSSRKRVIATSNSQTSIHLMPFVRKLITGNFILSAADSPSTDTGAAPNSVADGTENLLCTTRDSSRNTPA